MLCKWCVGVLLTPFAAVLQVQRVTEWLSACIQAVRAFAEVLLQPQQGYGCCAAGQCLRGDFRHL